MSEHTKLEIVARVLERELRLVVAGLFAPNPRQEAIGLRFEQPTVRVVPEGPGQFLIEVQQIGRIAPEVIDLLAQADMPEGWLWRGVDQVVDADRIEPLDPGPGRRAARAAADACPSPSKGCA